MQTNKQPFPMFTELLLLLLLGVFLYFWNIDFTLKMLIFFVGAILIFLRDQLSGMLRVETRSNKELFSLVMEDAERFSHRANGFLRDYSLSFHRIDRHKEGDPRVVSFAVANKDGLPLFYALIDTSKRAKQVLLSDFEKYEHLLRHHYAKSLDEVAGKFLLTDATITQGQPALGGVDFGQSDEK